MRAALSKIKANLTRYKYLANKLYSQTDKDIIIYTKWHIIYKNIFEYTPFKRYKFVYLDFSKPFNSLEQKLFNKAKLVHSDASGFVLDKYKDKAVVAECEGLPTQQMQTDPRVNAICLLSKAAAPHLVGTNPKITISYPAIKLPATRHIKPAGNEIVLTAIGFGSIRKGLDVMYKIYETLRGRNYPVRLIIAGTMGHNFTWFPEITREAYDKANFPEIERKIKEDPHAHMAPMSNAQIFNEVFPQTDIYFHLCRIESFGYSILEAMSFGIPVVATRQWAIPEIVEDNVSGILVNDFKDDINSDEWFRKSYEEGLAATIKLIENPDLRKKMGTESYNRIRTIFNIEKKRDDLEQLYNSILDKK